MAVEVLPLPTRADAEELEVDENIVERVDDQCASQTPTVDRVKLPHGLGGACLGIADEMSFVEDDPPETSLEEGA
jgi:hypothetical protein